MGTCVSCVSSKRECKTRYYKSGLLQSCEWRTSGVLDSKNSPAYIENYENGNARIEEWYTRGILHNDNGYARVKYFKNGKPQIKEWYKNGNLHRENYPACITFFENGNIKSQKCFILGKCINLGDIPSHCEFYHNGVLKLEVWSENFTDGVRNCDEDGASIIHYYQNGGIFSKEWKRRERQEQSNSPDYIEFYENGAVLCQRYNDRKTGLILSFTEWYKNGNIRVQEWYKDGKLHRGSDCPARIEYYENGKVKSKEWRILGNLYRKKGSAYIEYPEKVKLKMSKRSKMGKKVKRVRNV